MNQPDRIRRELGLLGLVFLWLLGRPLSEPEVPTQTGALAFYQPFYYWRVELPIKPCILVQVQHAPNAFHRGMQRLAFGLRWKCLL